jgi:hypothetical protein
LEGGELAFAQQQAKEWVSMNAIEDVSGQIPPDWIVCNTVVAYRNGVMDRICWAGGPMNEGVQTDSFRMENVAVVLRLLRPGDFMFSFDLKKGYFQVPLKPEFQKFALMESVDVWSLVCAEGFQFHCEACASAIAGKGSSNLFLH